MAQPIYANNVAGLLAANIGPSDNAILLGAGQGALFPAITGGNWYMATLIHATLGTFEVVKVTGKSADTLTVTRGQDGTTATSFTTGSIVELRVTAQVLRDLDWRTAAGTANGVATLDGTSKLTQAQIPTNIPLLTAGKLDMAVIPDAVATDTELATKLPIAGGTITGDLVVNGNLRCDTGGSGLATFAVGNDTIITDNNTANALALRGVVNSNVGYLQFGTGPLLGWDTANLVFGGNVVWHLGNFNPGTKLNQTNPSAAGDFITTGRITSGASYFSGSSAHVVLSANGGPVYLRPFGADNATNQTIVQTSGLVQAVDLQIYSDKRRKKQIRKLYADIDIAGKLQLKSWVNKADNRPSWGVVAQDLLAMDLGRHVGGTEADGYSVDYAKLGLEVGMANHLRLSRIEAALNLR